MLKQRPTALLEVLRRLLTCAIGAIALLVLLSVDVHLFPSSKVRRNREPRHFTGLDGARWSPRFEKLWNPPPNCDFSPCIYSSVNYTVPGESRGYLLVHTNGGLNQMRAGICDMVAVVINAALVILELDKMSFWQDSNNFSNVFDEYHFIKTLASDIKVIKKLPMESTSDTKAVQKLVWCGVLPA